MKITIPKQHDFPEFLKKEVLEKTGCSVPNWEICVQREDDVAWSVVLSFLISANFRNPDDFARRLKSLTGETKNLKVVKKVIGIFNPFKNRYSYFYNEDLKEIVTKFKDNLKWDTLPSVPDKLTAVSKRLECPLLLIWKDKDSVRYKIYSDICKDKFNIIALHSTDYTNEDDTVTKKAYNFLLDNELGIKLKFFSLRYFLKEAKISIKISRKVESLVKKGEHFLISLLESDHQDVISTLYDSAYLVSKLKEAGFQTDPSSKDSGGFSALHHALALGKIELLYKLYNFSANNCCQTEGSYRNPDSVIVSNLQQLGEILLLDFAKFEASKHPPKYDKIKKDYDDLLRFHKFLTKLSAEILKIKSKLNYYERVEEIIFEASKRRDVILCVLDTYINCFGAVPSDSVFKSPFDDYIENINYYNSIDVATATIFFTHIILLKERLVLASENQFSQMELSFYQTISYHWLSYQIKRVDFKDNFLANEISKFSIYFVPLIRRLDNRKKVTEFTKNLRDTVITRENAKKNILWKEILRIFNSFPVFKNTIHLDRLKHYIDMALKINVVDLKSVLVIQRVLQVIGEYLHTDENNDDTFRRFLLLVLPKETCRLLRSIRHGLSHVKSYVFKSKIKCEKNFSLFRSIQKEIGSINQHFSLVYHFYKRIELSKFLKMIQGDIEEVRKLKDLYNIPSKLSPEFEGLEEIIFILLERHIFLSSGNLCKELFEIVLRRVENDIVDEIKWTDDRVLSTNQVLYILRPLKWLIEVLAENDGSFLFKIHHEKILDVLETMNICTEDVDPLEDLQIKTNKVILECKILLRYLDSKYTLKKRKTPLKRSDDLEHFLNILKGATFLSNAQKKKIRKEIPKKVKLDVITVEKLKKSVDEGFTLNIVEKASEFKISYIPEEKMKIILDLYSKKSQDVLSELEITNPVSELEEILLKNSATKKNVESLCEIFQFSDNTRKLLENLVSDQRKKIPENDLKILLERIESLEKILIKGNEEIHDMWLKIKRQTSKRYVFDRIVSHYMRDPALHASVEMLLLDCMSIFESVKKSKSQKTRELEGQEAHESESQKGIKNIWIKTSNLYCGINLRNIISHGDPFLERLCDILAPDDLAAAMIKNVLQLIEDKDVIQAILTLYEFLNNDYVLLKSVINSTVKNEYSELRDQILKCDEWETYTSLLANMQTPSENQK